MMMVNNLANKASVYLAFLCRKLSTRQVGSVGNRAATDFCAANLAAFGFAVEKPAFDCLDWDESGASLQVDGQAFEVFPSPYSLGFAGQGQLAALSTLAELEAAELGGKIALLRGELAKEPLMPKNFPFYNPEEHQRIYRLLEGKQPLALLSATAFSPQAAGALYPLPMFEDGDFDLPSGFMTEEQGARLAELAGSTAYLELGARRRAAQGCNVVARKGSGARGRVVLTAHIDAKRGTPGALDNAAGVTTLLLLAELLQEYHGGLQVEIVLMNGEDYYSSPGEQLYLRQNEGRLEEIVLGVNLDGVGYRLGETAYSIYECPPELGRALDEVLSLHPQLVRGDPWYQGDHFLFLANGRPALAFTSAEAGELLATVIHTPQDTPELVDPAQLASLARALRDLVERINGYVRGE
jgi:aminopeptidase YwaD